MVLIGPVVSQEKTFENCGRTTELAYTISSRDYVPKGSDKLKNIAAECVNAPIQNSSEDGCVRSFGNPLFEETATV